MPGWRNWQDLKNCAMELWRIVPSWKLDVNRCHSCTSIGFHHSTPQASTASHSLQFSLHSKDHSKRALGFFGRAIKNQNFILWKCVQESAAAAKVSPQRFRCPPAYWHQFFDLFASNCRVIRVKRERFLGPANQHTEFLSRTSGAPSPRSTGADKREAGLPIADPLPSVTPARG
jgi:hypothetical protein